jgi:ribonucleoside-diphosphate reductase alpha chain
MGIGKPETFTRFYLAYESCNLGSVNVASFVLKDGSDLDWNRLAGTVRLAVRFLDDVIDANYWPVPEIREISLGNRKIGLGIMGFADALFLLGIRYDSEEAFRFAEKLACFIQSHARDASEGLAKKRGTFPNWQGSIWDTKHHKPMRNAACTTIAPTGGISIIAGCSSGIEPIFSIISKRKVLNGREFMQLHPLVEDLGTGEGWLSAEVRESLSQGVLPRDIPEIPRKLADVLLTTHEISPEWHVRIQAAFQKYTDNAVSKTVNLPSDATVEDVDKIYRLAFELGCKGITVYRDRSRENQVITTAQRTAQTFVNKLSPRSRPRKTMGETIKFRTGCGTLFVTVNKDDNGLCEVFANLGKAGGCAAQTEATCRAVSIGLRAGVGPGEFINQLKSIRCLSTIARRKTNKDISVVSCADAIAAAIEEALGKNGESENFILISKCPSCGHPLRREEGCNVCDYCWYIKCG